MRKQPDALRYTAKLFLALSVSVRSTFTKIPSTEQIYLRIPDDKGRV